MEMEAVEKMATLRHPRIRKVVRQLEWDGGDWKHILIIKTDLSLNTQSADYDKEAVNQLVTAISTTLKNAKAGYHKIKIEEV
ncbi:hypothetical protein [Aestuariispira insulae]|uniref:Uncharacterized protein n=1 Tax=Aestuariispira insulae TaxID=1461337 RepID=A0A3D9HUS5_9PROT|nr:hypothetical protein [Aestuariispira insulae]RED53264.1 hypothetical protein DFP90_10146 [Aestuariispira insulae]